MNPVEKSLFDFIRAGDLESVLAIIPRFKDDPEKNNINVLQDDTNLALYGKPPLFYAIALGQEETVAALLTNDRIEVNFTDVDGLSPLMHAAANGNNKIIELLLNHKAEINKTDKKGRSALWHAANGGYTEVIHTLLIFGADPYLEVLNKQAASTPLSVAIANNHKKAVMQLLHFGTGIGMEVDAQIADWDLIEEYAFTFFMRVGDILVNPTTPGMAHTIADYETLVAYKKALEVFKKELNSATAENLALLEITPAFIHRLSLENLSHYNYSDISLKASYQAYIEAVTDADKANAKQDLLACLKYIMDHDNNLLQYLFEIPHVMLKQRCNQLLMLNPEAANIKRFNDWLSFHYDPHHLRKSTIRFIIQNKQCGQFTKRELPQELAAAIQAEIINNLNQLNQRDKLAVLAALNNWHGRIEHLISTVSSQASRYDKSYLPFFIGVICVLSAGISILAMFVTATSINSKKLMKWLPYVFAVISGICMMLGVSFLVKSKIIVGSYENHLKELNTDLQHEYYSLLAELKSMIDKFAKLADSNSQQQLSALQQYYQDLTNATLCSSAVNILSTLKSDIEDIQYNVATTDINDKANYYHYSKQSFWAAPNAVVIDINKASPRLDEHIANHGKTEIMDAQAEERTPLLSGKARLMPMPRP
jgi:ankyrin repeat protein